MATETDALDGRTARSARTRAAIVEALVELLMAGNPEPTAQQIAQAAGVSVRTVHGRFATLAELTEAAVDRATLLVLERVHPIDPSETLAVRIDLICGQRARINEELGPLLRAAARHRRGSAALARSERTGRTAARDQVRRVFAAELDRLEPGPRARRIATIDALLGLPSWTALRRAHDLSPDEARVAIGEALADLLIVSVLDA